MGGGFLVAGRDTDTTTDGLRIECAAVDVHVEQRVLADVADLELARLARQQLDESAARARAVLVATDVQQRGTETVAELLAGVEAELVVERSLASRDAPAVVGVDAGDVDVAAQTADEVGALGEGKRLAVRCAELLEDR